MSFSKIATLFLALAFVGQAANASTNPFRGDRRKLDDAKVDQLMQVQTSSNGKSSSSSEDCGDDMQQCCAGLRCNLPGLGCRTFFNGGFVDYPVCTPCGDITQPCCQDQCDDKCSGSCNLGATCSLQNECVACGGGNINVDRVRSVDDPQPCCKDEQGNPFCDTGRTCVDGLCQECGEQIGTGAQGTIYQPCCVDSSGHKSCNFGYNCYNGECTKCGVLGTNCCEGGGRKCFVPSTTCNSNNICILCGTAGQACCEGSPKCNVNQFCNAGTGRCEKCGALNEACCPDGVKCRDSNGCSTVDNRCEVPPSLPCETRTYTQSNGLTYSDGSPCNSGDPIEPCFQCAGTCLDTYTWTTNLNTPGNAMNEAPITINDMFPLSYNGDYVVNSVTVKATGSQICVGSNVPTPSPFFVAEINGVTVATFTDNDSQVTKSGSNCPCSEYAAAGCVPDFVYESIDLTSSGLVYSFGVDNDLSLAGLLIPVAGAALEVTVEVCPKIVELL